MHHPPPSIVPICISSDEDHNNTNVFSFNLYSYVVGSMSNESTRFCIIYFLDELEKSTFLENYTSTTSYEECNDHLFDLKYF